MEHMTAYLHEADIESIDAFNDGDTGISVTNLMQEYEQPSWCGCKDAIAQCGALQAIYTQHKQFNKTNCRSCEFNVLI
jgi:hypothetical protein